MYNTDLSMIFNIAADSELYLVGIVYGYIEAGGFHIASGIKTCWKATNAR